MIIVIVCGHLCKFFYVIYVIIIADLHFARPVGTCSDLPLPVHHHMTGWGMVIAYSLSCTLYIKVSWL